MAQENARQMSQERMGEIALMYVKDRIRQASVPMDSQKLLREVGNQAKALGVPNDEVKKFLSILLTDAFSDVIKALDK